MGNCTVIYESYDSMMAAFVLLVKYMGGDSVDCVLYTPHVLISAVVIV